MHNEHPFHALIRLVVFDQEQIKLTLLAARITKELHNIEEEYAQQDREDSSLQSAIHTMQKTVDLLELDLKLVAQKIRDTAQKQLETGSHKEQLSLEKEIQTLQKNEQAQEALLMDTWNKLDAAKALKKKQEPIFAEKKAILKERASSKQKELEELTTTITAKESERVKLHTTIPAEWIERYEALRSRMTDPIIAVTSGECPACYNTLPPKEIMRLNRGALIGCRGCHRLLYNEKAVGGDSQINELLL